jgi:hypothetical protein
MLTQLSTVKLRLAIAEADTQHDALLTSAIESVSALFDSISRRRLARGADLAHEFAANLAEICVHCYPVESVSQFELKANDLVGWTLVDPPDYLVRQDCVLSLRNPLGTRYQQARVIYTGGYVLPGSSPGPGQTALPADLEHAAVEQIASWFLHRDKVGLVRNWPSGGVYQQFVPGPLLPQVESILARYQRWNL